MMMYLFGTVAHSPPCPRVQHEVHIQDLYTFIFMFLGDIVQKKKLSYVFWGIEKKKLYVIGDRREVRE